LETTVEVRKTIQVVICGGGVIGACTAYFLSLRGIEVIVIERAEVAAAASGKAGGFLALDWCASTPLDALARQSFQLHAALPDRIAGDWGYRRMSAYSGLVVEERDARRHFPSELPWLSEGVIISHQPGPLSAARQRPAGALFRRGGCLGTAPVQKPLNHAPAASAGDLRAIFDRIGETGSTGFARAMMLAGHGSAFTERGSLASFAAGLPGMYRASAPDQGRKSRNRCKSRSSLCWKYWNLCTRHPISDHGGRGGSGHGDERGTTAHRRA
jgi:FAD dependent oxidoreductase